MRAVNGEKQQFLHQSSGASVYVSVKNHLLDLRFTNCIVAVPRNVMGSVYAIWEGGENSKGVKIASARLLWRVDTEDNTVACVTNSDLLASCKL